jgi:hypothetical protein
LAEAIFIPSDGGFIATEIARGPWDPNAQHGGAPAALLTRAFEQLPGGENLAISRLTFELLRPVPLGRLEVAADIVRPGRRVQLLEGTIVAGGQEVVRARALRVRRAQAPASSVAPPPPPPSEGVEAQLDVGGRTFFGSHGMEIRFVAGGFYELGAATAWFRLRVPLVAGEEPSALQRLAAAADFPNGISAVVPWNEYLFINPDLTIYVDREPAGEWIAVDAQTVIAEGGVGISEGALYDQRGRVGRAMQSLLVAPANVSAPGPASEGALTAEAALAAEAAVAGEGALAADGALEGEGEGERSRAT